MNDSNPVFAHLVKPDEAARWADDSSGRDGQERCVKLRKNPHRLCDERIQHLAHTVATEPERIRAAIIAELIAWRDRTKSESDYERFQVRIVAIKHGAPL
jgi:hypothetical protein